MATSLIAPSAVASPASLLPEQQLMMQALAEALASVQGAELTTAIELLTTLLRSRPFWPAAQHAALVRLIAHLDQRREEAELTADPARRADIGRVGAHFARKAQSGFAGRPLS